MNAFKYITFSVVIIVINTSSISQLSHRACLIATTAIRYEHRSNVIIIAGKTDIDKYFRYAILIHGTLTNMYGHQLAMPVSGRLALGLAMVGAGHRTCPLFFLKIRGFLFFMQR